MNFIAVYWIKMYTGILDHALCTDTEIRLVGIRLKIILLFVKQLLNRSYLIIHFSGLLVL